MDKMPDVFIKGTVYTKCNKISEMIPVEEDKLKETLDTLNEYTKQILFNYAWYGKKLNNHTNNLSSKDLVYRIHNLQVLVEAIEGVTFKVVYTDQEEEVNPEDIVTVEMEEDGYNNA